MKSCLYEGRLRHRRYAPREHMFQYRVFYAYLDLEEIEEVFSRRWLWSCHRPAPVRFHRADYFGDPETPLADAVRERVAQATGRGACGPIRLLTHLRHFGHVFNPVSFYYCFDESGEIVETIVAEVTNTPWNERHTYVLPRPGYIPSSTRSLRFHLSKDFHISPFMPMDIRYDWRFLLPGRRLAVHMENHDADRKVFDATLTLTRRPINGPQCALALARYPLITTKVLGAIYWQALRLYLKRTPYYSHPIHGASKPEDNETA